MSYTTWWRSALSNHALVIALCGLLLSVPIWLHTGEVSLGADIQYHLLWTENFARQFWSGEPYPRWLESMNGGLGSPIFFVYPPLPFYAAAPWYPLTVATGVPWFAVAATATIAMIASGFAAHAWLRSFATPTAALIGALFYMATPFHLGADLFARFSFAELWAFVWMPLVLRASRPAAEAASAAVLRTCLGVAIPYALLALSHLPTLLLFSALPVLQAMILPAREHRLRHFCGVIAGMTLGMAIAAAFVVPAWTDRALASIDEHSAGAASYANNFLLDAAGNALDGSINWFGRGLDLWAGLLLAFALYATVLLWKQRRLDRESWLWIVVAAGSVLVTMRITEVLWRNLPLIQIVQFPWRFGTVSTLAVAALIALIQSRVEASTVRSRTATAFLALSLLVFAWIEFEYASNMTRYPAPWFAVSIAVGALVYCGLYGLRRPLPGAWLIGGVLLLANIPHVIPQLMWQLDTLRGRRHPDDPAREAIRAELAVSQAAWEFRIPTIPAEKYNAAHIAQLRDSLPPIAVKTGTGKASMLHHSARRSTFEIDATTPVTVVLRRYFFPGTEFRDASGKPLGTVAPSPDEGLVQAELPAGTYRAELVLIRRGNEQLGLWISCIAIVLWIGLTIVLRRTRKPSEGAS